MNLEAASGHGFDGLNMIGRDTGPFGDSQIIDLGQ